jgi:hypothetical protein
MRAAVDDVVATADGKLEAVVAAVDEELRNGREGLTRSLDEIRSHVLDQTSLAEQQARGSERALRDGLAALGGQILESEEAFARAGEALRSAVDRLGEAIGETDRRMAAREDRLPVAAAAEARAYVAFAPTGAGYRLVEVDGAPPAVGDHVELRDEDEPLVVSRMSVSPLPLDLRPCVYLERPR